MSDLKKDNMRMPTVGSNDQLARTTVTGQNPFTKAAPASLPGARPPGDSAFLRDLQAKSVMARGKLLNKPIKMAEAPFYGRTGALYKPEYGPVVSQVPDETAVKASPSVPDPAEQMRVSQMQQVPPAVAGFAKRASELGWTKEQFETAFNKVATIPEFSDQFTKEAMEKVSISFGGALGTAKNLFGRAARTGGAAASKVRNVLPSASSAGNLASRAFYNPAAARAAGMQGSGAFGRTMAGIGNSGIGRTVGQGLVGGALGSGVDFAEDASGYDTGVDWTSAGMLAGGARGLAGRAGRKLLHRTAPGLYNSRAFQGGRKFVSDVMEGPQRLLPGGLKNRAEGLGWTLGTAGFVGPGIMNAAESRGRAAGEEQFRVQADQMAQSLGFNDAVSAMASPIGQAIFGYNSGGLSGAASGLWSGFTGGPTVQNGRTVLANGMNSDDVWAGLSQVMEHLRGSGASPEQTQSVMASLLSSLNSRPSEVAAQVG